jgi:predicted kinase
MVTKREAIDTTEITMFVNGKSYGVAEDATSYYHRDQVEAVASVKAAALVLKCGDTVICIQAVNAEQVLKARAEALAEAEADQDWAVIVAERARKNAEDREYEEHVRKVESMMTLNGHTY